MSKEYGYPYIRSDMSERQAGDEAGHQRDFEVL